MKSLLLSMIARLSKGEGPEAFVSKYPGAWLVWEPGSWKPAEVAGTVLLSKEQAAAEAAAVPGGEGLAYYMAPLKKRIFLGRDPLCDIVINDGTLSHKHLMFGQERPDRWNVSDLGSSNGTWVDGERLAQSFAHTLSSGTRIKAGSVLLGYYSAADVQERARLATSGSRGR